MTTFETVRVAAIQAASVALDADATIEKAIGLLDEAAEAGAQLAVLPECFVSLYPDWSWTAAACADRTAFDELYARMWEEAVTIPGPRIDRLVEACARTGLHCVVGVNERESGGSFTLYNSFVVIGPGGVLHVHRKLMPTKHERMFHGQGTGDDLRVVETPFGRVGGLICWENRMPLARYLVYRGGPQIWVAPTADSSDGWIALLQTIAIESGAHVIGAPQFVDRSAFPADFPIDDAGRRRVHARRRRRRRPARRAARRPALRRGGNGRRRLRPPGRPPNAGVVRPGRALRPRRRTAAAARPAGARLSPRQACGMRASSAAPSASRTGSSSMRSSTSWKKPRTIRRSASARERPRAIR